MTTLRTRRHPMNKRLPAPTAPCSGQEHRTTAATLAQLSAAELIAPLVQGFDKLRAATVVFAGALATAVAASAAGVRSNAAFAEKVARWEVLADQVLAAGAADDSRAHQAATRDLVKMIAHDEYGARLRDLDKEHQRAVRAMARATLHRKWGVQQPRWAPTPDRR